MGVLDIFEIEGTEQEGNVFRGGVRPGIVVVANSTWVAMEARKKLIVQWDEGELKSLGTNTSEQHFIDELSKEHEPNTVVGDPKAIIKEADVVFSQNYINDYQVNACMESLNAVAHFKGDRVEVWAGTQAPQLNRDRIAELLEFELDQVQVHPNPSGGGFGRRYYCDYVEEAVIISKKINQPVKLMWTREDTIRVK